MLERTPDAADGFVLQVSRNRTRRSRSPAPRTFLGTVGIVEGYALANVDGVGSW